MRKYLISAAVLTLLTAPSAWSDPPGDRGNRGHEGQGRAEPSHQGPPQARQIERGGPAPQASMQAPPNRGNPERGFDRGNRGPAPQAAMEAPPDRADRGDNGRGFERREQDRRAFNDNNERGNRGPQAAIQAAPNRVQPPPNRGDNDRRAFNDNRPNRDVRSDFNRDGRTDFRPDNRRGPGIGGPRHDFSGFRDYHRNFQVSRRFQAPFYRRPAGWYSHRWAFGEFLPTAFWARDYWLIDFAIYDLPPPPFGAVWVRVDHDALLIDEDTGEIITVAYDVFY